MEHNGSTIYQSEKCQPNSSEFAKFSRQVTPCTCTCTSGRLDRGHGRLTSQVKSARLLATGQESSSTGKIPRAVHRLPEKAPDDPVSTIAIECDSEPHQDTLMIRRERPRLGVGIQYK